VHFKPGGAFRFLGVPANELTDTHVDLEALWGSATQYLREQLCTAANPAKCFRVLERALVVRLENTLEGHRAVRADLVAGLIAVANGGLVLALANGGPGSGNGVVGGAGALVLGMIALALGGLALTRSRRSGSDVTSPSRHE